MTPCFVAPIHKRSSMVSEISPSSALRSRRTTRLNSGYSIASLPLSSDSWKTRWILSTKEMLRPNLRDMVFNVRETPDVSRDWSKELAWYQRRKPSKSIVPPPPPAPLSIAGSNHLSSDKCSGILSSCSLITTERSNLLKSFLSRRPLVRMSNSSNKCFSSRTLSRLMFVRRASNTSSEAQSPAARRCARSRLASESLCRSARCASFLDRGALVGR
mmetsp:Transcript_139713/g.243268  ORF Transcript_139713/g.243268 Transcript_139713/m.243268 type:complete len:216 (-) Transcript_139713:361-1008(-)